MITTAKKSNVNELKELWQTCFGDDREYIDFFFSRRFVPKNTFVYSLNGRAVAQLFLLEGVFRVNGEEYPSYYLYAACTHPSFRRKGIMGELLKYTETEAKKRKTDFICLVPADKHLFDYYSGFSYKPVFSEKIITVNRRDYSRERSIETAFPEAQKDISGFRNKNLTGSDCFLWDNDALKYAADENVFSDGGFICNGSGYALFRPVGENVCRVIEICARGGETRGLLNAVFDFSGAERLIINAPLDFEADDVFEVSNNAMALAVTERAKKLIEKIDGAFFGLPLE